jgi:hypothetical protein
MLNPEDEIIILLEQLIDARFEYLKEKEYENHHHAYKIKVNNYDPVVKDFKDFLKKQLYFRSEKD